MRAAAITVAALLLAPGAAAPPAGAQDHRHQTMESPRGVADSIYALSASLVDQRGQQVGLDVFRGHQVLISMFYATCPDACPLLIADLQRIESELSPRLKADLRVVLVSLDPGRDTPEALLALAQARHVDESRWRLLRAPADTVREIAALLGIKYRRLPDGNFNHSSIITLLNADGVVVARDEAVGGPHTALLKGLQAAQAPPTR